jgi:hypothetical protein
MHYWVTLTLYASVTHADIRIGRERAAQARALRLWPHLLHLVANNIDTLINDDLFLALDEFIQVT